MGTGTGVTGWLRVAAGARCRECLASSSPASPEALSLLFSGCRCLLHLSLCPSLCGSVLSHCLHLCVCLRYPTCLFSGAVSAATCLCPSIFGSTSDFVFSWALGCYPGQIIPLSAPAPWEIRRPCYPTAPLHGGLGFFLPLLHGLPQVSTCQTGGLGLAVRAAQAQVPPHPQTAPQLQ